MAGPDGASDRGNGHVGVVGGKHLQVVGVVGGDDAAAQPDGGRNDEGIDRHLGTGTGGGKEMAGDASDTGSSCHNLREASRQHGVDGLVDPASSVELDEHGRRHADRIVPRVGAAKDRSYPLVASRISVRVSEGGERFAVEN